MILYVGGMSQGKWRLVRERFGDECRVVDGSLSESAPGEGEILVIRHAERIISQDVIRDHELIKNKASGLAEQIASLEEKGGTVVVITRETGCGVVPVDEEELMRREAVGRFQTEIAGRSQEVIRVVCGIGTRLR